LIPLSDVKFALVVHEEPPKQSLYLNAGSPTRCFLPSCQKPFEHSCFRGDDNHYYCSEVCAQVGIEADLAVVEPMRKRN
jgi:hypothetical protein